MSKPEKSAVGVGSKLFCYGAKVGHLEWAKSSDLSPLTKKIIELSKSIFKDYDGDLVRMLMDSGSQVAQTIIEGGLF